MGLINYMKLKFKSMSTVGQTCLICALVFLALIIADALVSRGSINDANKATTAPEKTYEWYSVDSVEDLKTISSPKSNFYYHVDEASGYEKLGVGHIKGMLRNSTGSDLSNVKIIFGTYSKDGVKITTCSSYVETMSAGEIWNFEAACSRWEDSEGFQVDAIEYVKK